jgi:CDP-paratose 2-epimerase
MAVAVITGSCGLIGSEAAKYFHHKGLDIVGIDNDMRGYFFGTEASTTWQRAELERTLPRYRHHFADIRNEEAILAIFRDLQKDIRLVIHAAGQPSHDWAAREPTTDFTINANGTMVMLEATRKFCPEAAFIFMSTNKVYGDTPNRLPLEELETRWEIRKSHSFFKRGIDESMSIDDSLHSLFGVSKTAADLMVQEYGKYFGLKTSVFRGGCLTGPAHSGAELHGFLAYLVKCAVTGKTYTVHGYKGKQVRDNIHSRDLVEAFWQFFRNPRSGAVYNIGGSRHSNCSVLEAIERIEGLNGKPLRFELSEQARSGDHMWWISDVGKFQRDYPEWSYQYDLNRILREMVEATREKVAGTRA